MADRGFVIADDLKSHHITLKIPSFLGGRSQLTAAEVKESQTIASVRIHVESAIQRVKKYRVLRNIIQLTLNGSIKSNLDFLLPSLQPSTAINPERREKSKYHWNN